MFNYNYTVVGKPYIQLALSYLQNAFNLYITANEVVTSYFRVIPIVSKSNILRTMLFSKLIKYFRELINLMIQIFQLQSNILPLQLFIIDIYKSYQFSFESFFCQNKCTSFKLDLHYMSLTAVVLYAINVRHL